MLPGTRKSVGCMWIMGLALAGAVRAEIVVPNAQGTPPAAGAGGIAVPPPAAGGAVTAPAPTGGVDLVEFVNRDKLHGTLSSVKPGEYGLRWKHECSPREIDFALRSLAQIKLAPRKAAGRRDPTALIRLTNDDLLTGTLQSLDAEKLVVDTWYAGRMEIRRAMVKTINPNTGSSSVVYEGPNGIDEWTFAQQDRQRASWKIKNGTLYSVQSYPLGRLVDKLPNTADIELEFGWLRYPELTFAFFTDNIQNYYGNGYMLQLSGNTLQLYRCTRNGEQNSLGRAEIRRMRTDTGGRARLNVLVDKPRKVIAVMMDGVLVQQWTDPQEFGGAGKGILFQPQNQGNLRVHRIKISAWDGKIPQAVAAGSAEVKEDLLRFANNDKISGGLKSIENGKAKLETSYATLDVPVERIAQIDLSPERGERARRFEQDVKVQFTELGTVTLRLDGLEGGKVSGFSENFGKVTMPLEAFSLLKFNLYREPSAEEAKGAGPTPPGEGGDDGVDDGQGIE